jgi:predicted regulator of Ras-like GTPase activity (Roadblock/LC7/MglB family)
VAESSTPLFHKATIYNYLQVRSVTFWSKKWLAKHGKTLEAIEVAVLQFVRNRGRFALASSPRESLRAVVRMGENPRCYIKLYILISDLGCDLQPSRPVLLSQRKRFLMADTPIVMHEQQYQQIKAVLAKLCQDSAGRVVFLVDKDGQQIAMHGDVGDIDTTSLASLTAGNVAATGGMAQLIGEKEFPTLSHEGERENIHITIIGRVLLVVVFDERSSLGLVKLRVKQISNEIATIFEEILRGGGKRSAEENSLFAEITDEDIDSLFS